MIHKVEGDILLSKADALVLGVGINDPMDKGLALAFRNQYPLLVKDLNRWCHQHNTKPGEAWLWHGPDKVRIINLIICENSQFSDHHYDKATLINIKLALAALVKLITVEKLVSIALPRLGTGFGDLEWDDVWPLIDENLGGLDIPVYLYVEGRTGLAANEPENPVVNRMSP